MAATTTVRFLLTVLALAGGAVLAGVHSLATDLTAKRLEILKELVPKLRRAVTFYDPGRFGARASVQAAREAARQLGLELVERHVRSVEELREGLRALRAGEAGALFLVSDGLVSSQAPLVIEAAKGKRLPAMFYDPSAVAAGGLASYGVSLYAVGRLSARYVHRVLLGASPADQPVERFDRFELVLNARTARELGLTIPRPLLDRADQVIE